MESSGVHMDYGGREKYWVYPTMPTASLCSDEDIWTRFKNKVISYLKEHVSIALATGSSTMLPYVSSEQPFQFNIKGHNIFLSHV